MERKQEIVKLVNVLRKTARTVQQAQGRGDEQEAAAFGAAQYNRVLTRLQALDTGVESLFEPLPEGSPVTVVAMACRQLAAYYEDETGASGEWEPPPFGPDAFKEFWQRSAGEIEDFGAFIRDNVDAWMRRYQKRREGPSEGSDV